ncbi:MAG: endonuclease [Bacilli bacterium]
MKYTKISLILLLTLLVGCAKNNSSTSENLSEPSTSTGGRLDSSSSEDITEVVTSSEASIESSSPEVTSAPSSESGSNLPSTPEGIEVPSSVLSYYTNVNFNLSGQSLKVELFNKIKGHTTHIYDNLNNTMRQTDRDWNLSPDPNDQDPYMVLIYATYNFSKSSDSHKYSKRNTTWDKEHIWAKYHGGFSNNPPAGSDMHHLRASDKQNNNSRGNLDFGTVTTGSSYVKDYDGGNSGKRGSYLSQGTVYEPLDIYKGDVARAMFYMATRYYAGNNNGNAQLNLVDYVTGNTSNGIFGVLSVLLEWHLQDPVDEFEFRRNGLVQGYQNNRNPYIDFPSLANKVFA